MRHIPRPPLWRHRSLHHLQDAADYDACIGQLDELDALLNSQLTTLFLIFLAIAAAYADALHRHHGSMSTLFFFCLVSLAFVGVSLCVGLIHTPWETRWHFEDRSDWKMLAERRARQVSGKATTVQVAAASLVVAIVPVGWAVAVTFPRV